MPPRISLPSPGTGAFPSSGSTVAILINDASNSATGLRRDLFRQEVVRNFSQTPKPAQRIRLTKLKRDFYAWLRGPGLNFRIPLPRQTNYLGAYDVQGNPRIPPGDSQPTTPREKSKRRLALDDARRPFPMNNQFKSLPVLSEELREAIYDHVIRQGMSVREVSVKMNVSMERIGAVVRLKEIEKRWKKEGLPLANTYSKAVMAMLPQTSYKPREPLNHESIMDLPVHPYTQQQIFHPVSESRKFTRQDAAKVFGPRLLPADMRVPHPQLIMEERMKIEQWRPEQKEAHHQEMAAEEAKKTELEMKRQKKMAQKTKVIEGRRFDFRFKDIDVSSQSVGSDGRASSGVGWRYGFPHEDRKRGQVKIPTRVD